MKYKKSLAMGSAIESEHKDVMQKIRRFLKKNKRLPKNQTVYKWIAETHIHEFPKYYSALSKMEKKLKKERL